MGKVLGSGVSRLGDFLRSRYALALLMTIAIASPTWAQTYKSIQPAISDKQAKADFIKVGAALRNPAGFGADKQAVTDYFMKYFFPKMTQYRPADLAELGKSREILFSRYIRMIPNADSQQELSEMALKVAKALTQGNYHPAVRYNAVLILGNLDQQVAGPGAPPVPKAEATAVMLDLLEQSDFGGVPVHPSVKLGALVGLERHAQFSIDPQYAERATKVALDVIAEEKPPEDVSQDIHQWMKCRAASILAYQAKDKPDARTVAALNGLMANENLDLDNRAFVASLMQRMDFTKADGFDAPAATTALGKLSQDVMKTESDLADKFQDEMLGGDEGGFAPRRGRSRRNFNDDDNAPKYERRRLAARLNNINSAGTALVAGSPADAQAKLKALMEAIRPALAAATDKDAGDLDIVDKVIAAARDVDQVVAGWNGAAGAAADASEADFSTASAQ